MAGVFFLVSLSFFFYQHFRGSFWDFTAYVLNARHMLGIGGYFEWMRPPLVPLAMVPFIPFGRAGEYAYIAATLAFFIYASFRLSHALKASPAILLLFLIQPLFLIFGAAEGSELLGAALLFLFFEGLIRKKASFAAFLGLAIISRYSAIYFLPLILFYRRPRKIIVAAVLALLPLALWFIVNLALTGNLFTGFADNYALNKVFREWAPVPWLSLLGFIGIPSLAAGYAAFMARKQSRHGLLMGLIAGITLYTYLSTPMKVSRYLFLLILPIAYAFTALYGSGGRYARPTLIAFSLGFCAVFLVFQPWIDTGNAQVEASMKDIEGIDDDMGPYLSNAWVHMNYYGHDALPYPGDAGLDYLLLGGYKAVVFKELFPVETGLEGYPVIEETDKVIVIGLEGLSPEPLPLDTTYLGFRTLEVGIRTNSLFQPGPCGILFEGVALKACESFHHSFGRERDMIFSTPAGYDSWASLSALSKNAERATLTKGLGGLTGQEKAVAYEKLASLSTGPDRWRHLLEAADEWESQGVEWRASLLSSLSPDWEPIPKWSAKGLSQKEARYCDLVSCIIPPLAVWNNGHWYLPDDEGTYKYRASNPDIESGGNHYLSRTVALVNDPDITVTA